MNRSENIRKQQAKGAKANKVKGCLSFIRSKSKKVDIYFNEMIDELINTGYYNEIYNKYLLSNVDIDDIPIKDFNILELLNFVEPDELPSKYRGINIRSLDIPTNNDI